MLNVVNRAGILTFDIKKKDVTLSISCTCISGAYADLIVSEFKETIKQHMNNKEVKREMERPS